MTIKHIYHDDPQVQLILDRNYLHDIVTVTIDYYGTTLSIQVPTAELIRLVQVAGLT